MRWQEPGQREMAVRWELEPELRRGAKLEKRSGNHKNG